MVMSEENVILALCWAWGLSEVVGSYMIPWLRGARAIKSRCDRGSRAVIWFSLFGSILVAVYFGTKGITLLPEWFFYFGLVMMVLGILFRQWSILILGRFFSTAVTVMRDHKIVTRGPYRFIRHPAYTGSLITLVGLGLASRTWGGTLLILSAFGLAYYYRIIVEENALRGEFGQEYVDYAKKTKRIIPFLL
jgi:protein-S-isoprenylcysteine O-methyltransferase Ste14